MKQLIFLLLLVGTALADDHPSVQAHDLYKYCKESLRMSTVT